ncbi:hypothetical protein F5148DRAFT_548810 [Russula earlei]|uniref:Uncharacterized protein n=1 Tax=Russula earlei TaxID=71964 RepID=A0ACC0UH40_9AGAM|nr:hypothetical protein F5148DRAFT_548810 [Russula earlei]
MPREHQIWNRTNCCESILYLILRPFRIRCNAKPWPSASKTGARAMIEGQRKVFLEILCANHLRYKIKGPSLAVKPSYPTPREMYNDSYGRPQQEASSSSSSVRGENAANDQPSSRIDFQFDGTLYDAPQSGPRYHQFSQGPQSQGAFKQPILPLPRDAGHVYGGGPSREHAPTSTVASSSSWDGTGHRAIPYGQPMSINGQATSTRVIFAGNPPTVTTYPPTFQPGPPPPQGAHAGQNAQGMFNFLWQMLDCWAVPEGDDLLRLTVLLKKVRN